MSVIQNNLLMTPEGYQISRSVRLRSSASAYFNRTPASASNRKTWTWSGWVKRGTLGGASIQSVFSAGANASYPLVSLFFFNDFIDFYADAAGTGTRIRTSAVYRDPSAWYHIVIACDTTQATAANRMLLYVNGVQVTSFSTNNPPAQNADLSVNNAVPHFHGAYAYDTTTNRFDGYLTEVNFIDGQALTPSSFGETNPVTGVWQPKKYAGTYGTNGFYLNFSDPSAATAAAIGKDYSGNGNNWTPNNISVTAGVTYDSMLDTPTPYADGGTGRGNYAVLNPLSVGGIYAGTLSNGNLTAASGSITQRPSTIGISSGSWYAEMTLAGTANGNNFGVELSAGISNGGWSWVYDGSTYVNGSRTGVVLSSWSTNATLMIAVDVTNGKLYFGQNGTWLGSANPSAGTGANISFTAGSEVVISCGAGTATFHVNFGQRPFAYTPPTGFKALNTQNLPDSTILKGSNQFNALLDTGANIKTTSNAAYTYQMQWIKDRANVNNHQLADTVRGLTAILQSNTTAAETTYSAPTGNSVGWVWNAGSVASSNTAGSITSQVAANVSAGFSVVTYTGTGANATVGHGLGVAPAFVIIKKRAGSAGDSWYVWHKAIGGTQNLALEATIAVRTDATAVTASPTSSVLNIGSNTSTNQSGIGLVAYCFAEVAGFSKFGSYTGNGSADGPFVYCGFRPRYIMVKRTDVIENWYTFDTARETYNQAGNYPLLPNSSVAEPTSGTTYSIYLDVLSNGFKLRTTSAGDNASGGTYIYAAFAENPFKNSLAR